MADNLDRAEAAMLRDIGGREKAMVEQLMGWSSFNTGSRNIPGLREMADILIEAFAPLGGECGLHPPAAVETIGPNGAHEFHDHGHNLRISLHAGAPMRVMMVGHMDTVFGLDHPFQEARWREPGVLQGPGVADMKGGIGVMLSALLAFEASPFAGRLGIDVVINADEEISSLGSAPLLADVARNCQVGLAYEPSYLPDGTLAGARKGNGNFSLLVKGKAAHAGRNPGDGRNALVAAADLAVILSELPARRPSVLVNPARIDGGGPNNVVPDLAILRVNVRADGADDVAWIEHRIDRAAEHVAARHEVKVERRGGFNRPPKPLDDHQLSLFTLVRDCGRDIGLDLGWKSSGGVCDGNNLAALGLAVVDTLGVRGGAIHSDREYMFADSLVERARLSALLLARLAQGRWGPKA